MTIFIEKPIITSLQVEIKPNSKVAFVDWQADYNMQIANALGFISLEFLSPSDEQKSWLIVQRFTNRESSSQWLNSTEYRNLLDRLKSLVVDNNVHVVESDGSSPKGNITEVIVTEVTPGKEKEYCAWIAKIHQIEAQFSGFRGAYVQSPKGKDKFWISLLQFDTIENLDHWLQSSERKNILRESTSLISSLESHRVISPYAGWFASIAKTGELPPVWKQTMVVLLVLFPIIVMELKFLSPQIAELNRSLGTFIGNAISVVLLSFPMMPIAIYLLRWWLTAHSFVITFSGTLLIGLFYLAEILLFWDFL